MDKVDKVDKVDKDLEKDGGGRLRYEVGERGGIGVKEESKGWGGGEAIKKALTRRAEGRGGVQKDGFVFFFFACSIQTSHPSIIK